MNFELGRLNRSELLNSYLSADYLEVDADYDVKHEQIKQRQSHSNMSRDNIDFSEYQLIDLQSTSDLFWPTILFRPAFDTEAVGFLVQLNDARHDSITRTPNYKYLNKFVQQFWQANQDKF